MVANIIITINELRESIQGNLIVSLRFTLPCSSRIRRCRFCKRIGTNKLSFSMICGSKYEFNICSECNSNLIGRILNARII